MNQALSESLTGSLSVDFPEFRAPPSDPLPLLTQKVKRAIQLGVREPLAMTLATVGATTQPSIRTLVISEISRQGVVFATQSTSRKIKELTVNPRAASLLYWRETSEQIAILGRVRPLPDVVSDQMWNSRPKFTHAMSVASRQSEPLEDIERLRAVAAGFAQMAPLGRPSSYTAYELVIEEIEFWASGTDRLHERLVYTLSDSGWRVGRLQP